MEFSCFEKPREERRMTSFEFGEGLFDLFDTEEDGNAPREHLSSSISRSLPSHLEERQKSNFVGLRNQYASPLWSLSTFPQTR